MRILHIYRDLTHEGGLPGQVRQLAAAQARLGNSVFALSDLEGRAGSPDGVGLLRLSEARRRAFDAVHVHGALVPSDLVNCWMLDRSRTWISPHGVLNPLGMDRRFGGRPQGSSRRFLKSRFVRHAVQPSVRGLAGVLAEAQYESSVLALLLPQCIAVVPMGVDEAWTRKPVRTPDLPNSARVTYLGRLDVYHKSLDLLLEAASAVRDRTGSELRVRIVGSDAEGSIDWLRARAAELNLREVTIEGPAWGDAKDDLLAETDWFWGVYRYAGMARACGEAIARGIPLIASREGNWGDWAVQGRFGVATSLDAASAAEALLSCRRVDDRTYSDLSAAAVLFARERTWERSALESIRAYAG